MKLTRLAALALAGLALPAQQTQPPQTHLKVGDKAPDFTLRTTHGKPFKLSDYRGQTVVLAFFPAAFTSGCTKEMSAYQANLDKFKGNGAQILGISTDNLPSQSYWAKEVLKVDFPMGSDFQRTVSELYGVLIKESGIANRSTFVIDADGVIQHIEQGSSAISIDGAVTACSRVRKR